MLTCHQPSLSSMVNVKVCAFGVHMTRHDIHLCCYIITPTLRAVRQALTYLYNFRNKYTMAWGLRANQLSFDLVIKTLLVYHRDCLSIL